MAGEGPFPRRAPHTNPPKRETKSPQMIRRKFTYEREQGQTVTEFAMILPILLLVLLGIVQLGIVFNHYVTLTDAARAGARKAVVSRQASNPSGTTVTAVRNSATNLDHSKLGVTVTSSWQQGQDVTVAATYPYQVSLLGIVVKSGTLRSQTTERLE
jgi:Flp pilus assembly protein TadG